MFEKVEVELELELEGGSGSGSGLVVQCGWKGTKGWYQWLQGVVTGNFGKIPPGRSTFQVLLAPVGRVSRSAGRCVLCPFCPR